MRAWLFKCFFEPIYLGYGYNLCNTLIYSLILIAFVFMTYKILQSLKVKINLELVFAIFPFVVLGSSTRVLEDMGILKGYLFISPFIWFLFFMFFLISLLLSYLFQKRVSVPYFKTMMLTGFLPLGIILGLLPFRNITGGVYVIKVFSVWMIILWLLKWSRENKIITGIHMFDASTTFVAINKYGYFEQHVLPRMLISVFGPMSFIFLKFGVVVSVLIILDRYSSPKDENLKNLVKICIGVLGTATSIRDFFRVICLV